MRGDVAEKIERSRDWKILELDDRLRGKRMKNEGLRFKGTDGVGLGTNKIA